MSTDPTTLAREVLDLAHEDETITVCTIPDNKAAALARAAISTAAELDAYREENTRLREERARMEALADRLENEAAADFDGVSGTSVSLVKYETAKAIRAALNGETDA